MPLNITFAGTIVDTENNVIEANLQIFVYNSKNDLTKWSNVFHTEEGDYNYNAGNTDISGQENSLGLADANGEYVIISVWKDGSRDNLDDIPTEYAYIIKELQGDELYIQNIQLRVNPVILCNNWEVPTEIIQGENIIALNHNTNEIAYEAQNITHYLYKKYRNEIIFPFLGPKLVEYNFNSEGYSTSNVYTPSVGGDTLIEIRVQDYFNNTNECSKITKVYYEVFGGFIDTDGNYFINEEITIISTPLGHTDKIQSTYYDFIDEVVQEPDFTKVLTTFGSILIQQYIIFFNGYENEEVYFHRTIQMDNIPPELNLQPIKEPQSDMAKKDYEFAHNGTDIDGYIEKVEWQIHRNNPDSEGNDNWNLYYTTGAITDLSNWFYNIDDIIGDLKVRAIVYDNLGATAQEDYEIANDCSDIALSFDNVDWSKTIRTIDFSQKVIKQVWKQEVKKINWDMKTVPITWDNTPKKVQWIQVTKGIKFIYKIHTKI